MGFLIEMPNSIRNAYRYDFDTNDENVNANDSNDADALAEVNLLY